MTIVTIRGTSGSGKTHLTRRVMDLYGGKKANHVERRKQPLSYDLHRDKLDGPPLRVLGHYESPTGGGDTISNGLDYIDGLVREADGDGLDVLYEGLVISSDFKRITALHDEGRPVLVVVLNTPLELCIESVQARRAAKGNTTPLNPKSTTEKHRAVSNMVPRFRTAGVNVHHVDRETAFELIRETLEFPS